MVLWGDGHVCWEKIMMNYDQCHRSSFGCHIAESGNMAPGFSVKNILRGMGDEYSHSSHMSPSPHLSVVAVGTYPHLSTMVLGTHRYSCTMIVGTQHHSLMMMLGTHYHSFWGLSTLITVC